MRPATLVRASILAGTLGAWSPAGAEGPPGEAVSTTEEIARAAAAAKPGTRIRIAPGTYDGGLYLRVRGAPGRPVVIEAADAARPPTFRGGSSGIQLTDPEFVELRHLSFAEQTGNGVNVDDGGSPATPARAVVLSGLTVRDVGPNGNHDGIKLSGVVGFRVEECTVERWGTGGSGVDMVGCRDGVVERCVFRHVEGGAHGSGVQAKGGSRGITVRRNRFEHAGGRAVNVGGSTGLAYFRPALSEWEGERFEAKDVRVEGNTFVGGDTPVAFVGADASVFRFNTVYLPGRWALRILQENREAGFVPSRASRFTDNLVVFRRDRWAEGGANVGPATEPGSFRFERNSWFCVDAPSRTRDLVRLPSPEAEGVYGVEPRFEDAAAGDLRQRAGGGGRRVGADALPE